MKGKILVVDDEDNARQSLAEILRLEGHHVTTAAGGEQALDCLGQEPFDLMVLDLKMPGTDGLEVLRRAETIAPDCSVIVLTAHGSLDSAVEALRHSAHDYLLKPASPDSILESVRNAITKKSALEYKRKLLEQMEASLRQLKDAEGLEKETFPVGSVVSLGNGISVDLDRREIWRDEKIVLLTPTEGKLLRVFLENKGQVLTHQEIVLLVQGYQTTEWEAPEILRPLVSRLRRKLGEFPGGRDWILNVRGTGYVFENLGE